MSVLEALKNACNWHMPIGSSIILVIDNCQLLTVASMITLARKLRVVDYFTLGWGTMVGVGWLVVMDDWLLRGGTLGGVLGFAIGGSLLLPIGYVYGQLVTAMPDAAGEVAYTAKVFPRSVSFATGWMMILAYFIVCPWEAVAVGKIAAYIFPSWIRWSSTALPAGPFICPTSSSDWR